MVIHGYVNEVEAEAGVWGSVGHLPVPASGALAPIGVALATIDLGGTLQLAARAERKER